MSLTKGEAIRLLPQVMPRRRERPQDSLALRSAYARRRDWQERLASAQGIGNEQQARVAAKFIAEYEDFIAELERHEIGS